MSMSIEQIIGYKHKWPKITENSYISIRDEILRELIFENDETTRYFQKSLKRIKENCLSAFPIAYEINQFKQAFNKMKKENLIMYIPNNKTYFATNKAKEMWVNGLIRKVD